MTKKVKLEYGIQENAYSKCIGCDIRGSFYPSDVPQTIYLTITYLDDKDKELGKSALCLYCGGEAISAIRQDMVAPSSMDENERRRKKELSDWYHNLANYKKK